MVGMVEGERERIGVDIVIVVVSDIDGFSDGEID